MAQISVIVPVYKAEKFLNSCVDSILKQTFDDLEVILIDDGSPDLSGNICDDYARKDHRVKVVHQKNTGVSAARNVGLDYATGEYITFVDSDDLLHPQMYEQMMKYAREYLCDLVLCDCMKVDSNAKKTIYSHKIRGGYYNEEQLYQEYYPHLLIMPDIEYPATISNWLCLFKNKGKLLPRYEVGIRYSEDWLFGCQIMLQAQSFYYMKGKAYYYYNCANQQSATHTFALDKWNDYKKLFFRIEEEFGYYKKYDFRDQIDKVLLLLVYNAVGDIFCTGTLTLKQKNNRVKSILYDEIVEEMFGRLDIGKLNIPMKLKMLTWCYKHPSLVPILSFYVSRRRN